MTEKDKELEHDPVNAPEPDDKEADPPEPKEPAVDPEVEARARRMGWVPKDDFRGPDDRWVDADTFVKRGEEIQPILKANLRKAEQRIAEMESTLKEFAAHHTQTEQRMYARAVRDLKAEQRKAAQEGDVEKFDRIDKEMQDLAKDVRSNAAPGQPQQKAVDPVAKDWADRNRWFREHPDMATWATTHHEFLLHSKPGLTLEENLDEVTTAVKKAFPDRFENPRRNGHSPVEGGSPPKRGGGKGYSDLPPEAKTACDKFVKQGLMKREEYVKDYFAGEA